MFTNLKVTTMKKCELCGKEEVILFQTDTYCPDCESDGVPINDWIISDSTLPGIGEPAVYPMDLWDPDKTPTTKLDCDVDFVMDGFEGVTCDTTLGTK